MYKEYHLIDRNTRTDAQCHDGGPRRVVSLRYEARNLDDQQRKEGPEKTSLKLLLSFQYRLIPGRV